MTSKQREAKMTKEQRDARDHLYRRGWKKSSGNGAGEFWKNPNEEFIMKGDAIEALRMIDEFDDLTTSMRGKQLQAIRHILCRTDTARFGRALGLSGNDATVSSSVRRLERMERVPAWFAKLASIYYFSLLIRNEK